MSFVPPGVLHSLRLLRAFSGAPRRLVRLRCWVQVPLFEALSVENVCRLLHWLLMEGKLLLLSSQLCLLAPVAELLRTLLLPIDWQCVYVPVCPDYMLRFLQAPMPFILGMSSDILAWLRWPWAAVRTGGEHVFSVRTRMRIQIPWTVRVRPHALWLARVGSATCCLCEFIHGAPFRMTMDAHFAGRRECLHP